MRYNALHVLLSSITLIMQRSKENGREPAMKRAAILERPLPATQGGGGLSAEQVRVTFTDGGSGLFHASPWTAFMRQFQFPPDGGVPHCKRMAPGSSGPYNQRLNYAAIVISPVRRSWSFELGQRDLVYHNRFSNQ